MLKTNTVKYRERLIPYFLQCVSDENAGETPQEKTAYFFAQLLHCVKSNLYCNMPERDKQFELKWYKSTKNVYDMVYNMGAANFPLSTFTAIEDLATLAAENERERAAYITRYSKQDTTKTGMYYSYIILQAATYLAKKYKLEV